MKAWIRRNSVTVLRALSHSPGQSRQILHKAVLQSMTAQKAHGWYRHSGYM
jgi:hypothetical protein